MNPIIKEQLRKVRVAKLPPYDENTINFHIEQGNKSERITDLEIGHRYNVVIDHSLVDETNNWYKTIHGNWNGGNGLQEQALIIKVVSFVGKMVKVEAVGTDNLFYQWNGFLPKSNIGIVEELS